MRDAFRQLTVLMLIVAFLSAGLACFDHFWLEPDRLPPCDPEKLAPGRICLETVLDQWGDRVVWVDARGADAFERGTLDGVRVFPLRNDLHAQELLAAALPALNEAGEEGRCIVIFCDRNCNSSSDIAKVLKEYDIEAPIFVLEGGWDELKRNRKFAP